MEGRGTAFHDLFRLREFRDGSNNLRFLREGTPRFSTWVDRPETGFRSNMERERFPGGLNFGLRPPEELQTVREKRGPECEKILKAGSLALDSFGMERYDKKIRG